MCNNTLVDTMKPQKRKWCIYSLNICLILREYVYFKGIYHFSR